MKKCGYCGLENYDTAVECFQCGRDEFLVRNTSGQVIKQPPLLPLPPDIGISIRNAPPQVTEAISAFAERLIAATPSTWVTYGLVVLNAAVFSFLVVQCGGMDITVPVLTKWGANYGPLTVHENQCWRLLTCCFLHVNPLHVVVNMLFLVQAGRLTERLFGNWFFLLIYFGCGIVASLTSLCFHPTTVSVGASGAVFGVYGALAGYLWREHGGLPRALARPIWTGAAVFIVWNLFSGIMNAMESSVVGTAFHIDLAAHCGGLIAGLIFGFLGARPLECDRRQALTFNRGVALAAAVGVLATLMLIPAIRG